MHEEEEEEEADDGEDGGKKKVSLIPFGKNYDTPLTQGKQLPGKCLMSDRYICTNNLRKHTSHTHTRTDVRDTVIRTVTMRGCLLMGLDLMQMVVYMVPV